MVIINPNSYVILYTPIKVSSQNTCIYMYTYTMYVLLHQKAYSKLPHICTPVMYVHVHVMSQGTSFINSLNPHEFWSLQHNLLTLDAD